MFTVRYDPSDDVWTELAPMASGRVLAGSVVHHGKIYVIGKELDYGHMRCLYLDKFMGCIQEHAEGIIKELSKRYLKIHQINIFKRHLFMPLAEIHVIYFHHLSSDRHLLVFKKVFVFLHRQRCNSKFP